MSNFDNILANIKIDFEKYDAAGFINEEKLYQDAVRATKRFGNDMALVYDVMIEVKNGKADLPENFQSMQLAYKCEPVGYKSEEDTKSLLFSSIYYERIESTASWSECESCCDEQKESIISENVYLDSGKKVTFYYNSPTLLRITKSPTSGKYGCQAQCKNMYVHANETPYHMRIERNQIHFNFEEGHIFFRYFGLPLDDNGNVDIPTSPNGHLEEYVELHLKRKLIERLMINNDAQPGLPNLYAVVQQQEQVSLRNAANELKMMALTPQHLKKVKKANRLETLQYEVGLSW